MKTPNELYEKALTFLGAFGAGQTASPEDMDVCNISFRPIVEELAAQDVVYIAVDPVDNDEACIDDTIFIPLAKLLANEIAPEFGIPSDEGAREMMVRRIRFTNKSGSYGYTQTAEYF